MWWAWPHLRRVWAAMGAVSVGLIVSYLYSLSSRQPLPDQRFVGHLLNDYWQWIGGGLIVLAAASGAAARAHRRHEMRAPQPLRIKPGGWRARRKRKSPEPAQGLSASGSALMVGRAAELAQLQEWLAQIRKGQRRVVFVAGEPGIGKSTIVSAFLDSVGSDGGVRIVKGQCVEQYGAGEPYMPILDGLTRLCRAPGGERILAILHRLAPAWLAQMPSLVSAEDRARLQGQSQGVTQQRMLREMAEAFEAITAESPLVLLIEDLHWSDYSTLDLIGAIARRTEPAQLMILGTYRPVEMLAGEHPLRALKAELELHQQCEELRLKLLSEGDVANYLHQRFASAGDSGIPLSAVQLADSTSPLTPLLNGEGNQNKDPGLGTIAQSAATIYARSEGNPLFMVNVTDYLVEQGSLANADRVQAPRNLRQMIERNFERLTPQEQAVLEAASVAGAEFSAAAVAAAMERPIGEIEACCTKLSRREQFVGMKEPISWPDGTAAASFRFHHALYQETLYGRLPRGHQVEAHRRIAQREEAAFGERAGEIASELAHHFRNAHKTDKSIEYLGLAAQQAIERSAHADAVPSIAAALDLLLTQSDGPERRQHELRLQMMLGQALIPLKGWSAAETGQAFLRAREICDQLGDAQELFPALFGLQANHTVRGEIQPAREIGLDLLRRAQLANDPAFLVMAHYALATILNYSGELTLAREHQAAGLSLYDERRDRQLALLAGTHPKASLLSHTGYTLWCLGYPDEAVEKCDESVIAAKSHLNPFAAAQAQSFLNIVRLLRRDALAVQRGSEWVTKFCAERSLGFWPIFAQAFHGWAIAQQGRIQEGLSEEQQSVQISYAVGAVVGRPHMLCSLAETYCAADRLQDALDCVNEAWSIVQEQRYDYYAAEVHRMKGELLLKKDPTNTAEARACFEKAVEIGRAQSGKSLELRATTSLARLLLSQGNREEARTQLAEIYNWFTEGFDTADLREAKAVLDQLNQSRDRDKVA